MMAETAAVLAMTTAAYLWTGAPNAAERRLTRHLPTPATASQREANSGDTTPATKTKVSDQRETMLRWAAVAGVAVGCMVVLGVLFGGVVAIILGALLHRSFERLERAEQRARRARLIADLPIAVDLLAACLRGGTPWNAAVDAVAEAVGGPLGEELQALGVRIGLGVDPEEAWLDLARDPILAPLARTAARAADSGAAPAAALSRLARDQRRTAHAAATARARATGVRALLPLGLCFLPAFVCIGIVPAVAGLAAPLTFP
ncbi:type II secretion system F family protein [Actinomadura kijaniata]|uniref:type II secretion system F family protein n=1 Tax=Actinomadura kijaniata TaxID=46161 RepID=UPI000AB8DB4E|nr:type II secretion system F family protein [Actinomadura kijaniata]